MNSKTDATGPEPDSPDIENFQVYSRIEILSLLHALKERRVLVTLYFSRGEDFLVTNILSVNPEFEELVLDTGSDAARNQRLLASQRIVAVAFIDKIKVQFSAPRAERTVISGRDAIRIRLPDSVLRLQRRDFFRVSTAIVRPTRCSAASPDDPTQRLEMTVVDISSGGVGLVVEVKQLRAVPGLQLKEFRLDLGEMGIIEGTLEVRHVSEAGRGFGSRHRLGCEFTGIPGTMGALLQRYVTALERERLARS